MSSAQRAEQSTRESILKLISDDENAKVSSAESRPKLRCGDEYIDLAQLNRGVQKESETANITMGHILPKSSVHAQTWAKILALLPH
jgi:hypothetical protein